MLLEIGVKMGKKRLGVCNFEPSFLSWCIAEEVLICRLSTPAGKIASSQDGSRTAAPLWWEQHGGGAGGHCTSKDRHGPQGYSWRKTWSYSSRLSRSSALRAAPQGAQQLLAEHWEPESAIRQDCISVSHSIPLLLLGSPHGEQLKPESTLPHWEDGFGCLWKTSLGSARPETLTSTPNEAPPTPKQLHDMAHLSPTTSDTCQSVPLGAHREVAITIHDPRSFHAPGHDHQNILWEPHGHRALWEAAVDQQSCYSTQSSAGASISVLMSHTTALPKTMTLRDMSSYHLLLIAFPGFR